ncbi:MAG: hypothetical protein MK226_04575 [Saprospiraceae bacterium]|jgi:hypothetical protein|nr:hypothetical protein [Saprospiraceae bacterium]
MRRLLFSISAFVFVLCLSSSLQAQDASTSTYKGAVGARLGYPLSLSVKYFLDDSHALEAYVGTRGWSGYRWTNLSAAYLIHKPLDIDGLDGIRWYVGGGASAYFWSFDDIFLGSETYSATTIGIQAYGGLDYMFEDTPINISIDWIPTYFFNGYGSGFGGGYGSLAVRYVFAK